VSGDDSVQEGFTIFTEAIQILLADDETHLFTQYCKFLRTKPVQNLRKPGLL
jgi:hypothetical protein